MVTRGDSCYLLNGSNLGTCSYSSTNSIYKKKVFFLTAMSFTVMSYLKIYFSLVDPVVALEDELSEVRSARIDVPLLFLRNLPVEIKYFPSNGHHFCLPLADNSTFNIKQLMLAGAENWRVFVKH